MEEVLLFLVAFQSQIFDTFFDVFFDLVISRILMQFL